jgi:uncharacterized protein HemX
MNSDIQMVVNICIELNENGKQPSVGMIKAKSPSPLAIPLIIRGLSYWKENKSSLKKVIISENELANRTPKSSDKKKLEALELLVQQLQEQLTQGNEAIKTLQSQVTDLQQQVAVLSQK